MPQTGWPEQHTCPVSVLEAGRPTSKCPRWLWGGLLFAWEMAAFPPRPHMASSLWGQRQPRRHQSYRMGPSLVTSFGPCLWRLGLHVGIWGNVIQSMTHCVDHRPLCRASVSPPASRPASMSIILSFQEDYLRAAIHLWAGSLLPGQFSEGEEITAWVAAGFPYC